MSSLRYTPKHYGNATSSLKKVWTFGGLVDSLGPKAVVCHERLGRLLKHYARKAA